MIERRGSRGIVYAGLIGAWRIQGYWLWRRRPSAHGLNSRVELRLSKTSPTLSTSTLMSIYTSRALSNLPLLPPWCGVLPALVWLRCQMVLTSAGAAIALLGSEHS